MTDGLNSTIGLTDSNGAIREQYSYDAYGNASESNTTSGFTNPYQYTGREVDTAGLYFYRARYYSPMMGRFISEDPMGFGGGQNSFYAYVRGNPLSYTDPYGLWQFTATGGAFLGVQLTFGKNGGQWNFGAHVGLGEGLAASYDPNDSGSHKCGDDWGVQATGQIGLGDGVDADAFVSTNQDESRGTAAFNDPLATDASYGVSVENGVLQPVGDPTVTFGEATFVGPGVSWYSSGGH